MSINGNELFGKDVPGNLSKQALKKAKKKGSKTLEKLIESNLPLLVEFYFTSYFKGNQRQKFEKHLLQVVGNDAYFIQPLKRLLKKANNKKKKADIEIPEGLHVILMDTIDDVRAMYRRKLKDMTGGNASMSPDTQSSIDDLREMTQELIDSTNEVCGLIVKKKAKKLEKLGMNEAFAIELAKTYIPEEIINSQNVRRYMYRTNIALYNIQRLGVQKNEDAEDDEDRWVQNVGLNLADPEVIKKVYEILYKGISRKVMISGLVGIMLERRGNMFENFTKPQLWCYEAITRLVLDLLEGNDTINFSGEKLGKKDKKKAAISKKELRAFMKMYSEEKAKDARNNRDSARRISFSSLAEDVYPRILKAFSGYTRERFETMWDNDIRDPQENRDRDKNRNNNGNRDNRNDDRNDRNDRDRNKNRH